MAKKILIIDDDPVVVTYLSSLFGDNGYATCTASSSAQTAMQKKAGVPMRGTTGFGVIVLCGWG